LQPNWANLCKKHDYNDFIAQVVELMSSGDSIAAYKLQSQARLGTAYGKIPDYKGIEVLKAALVFAKLGKCSNLIMNCEPEYYGQNEAKVDELEARAQNDKKYCEACKEIRAMKNSSFKRNIPEDNWKYFDYCFDHLEKRMAQYKLGESCIDSWKPLFDGVSEAVKVIVKSSKGTPVKLRNPTNTTIKILGICVPQVMNGLINNGDVSEKRYREALKTNILASSRGSQNGRAKS